MGVDLRLLPVDHLSIVNGRPWGFSHTVLNVPRNRECWTAFEAAPVEKLSAGHSISSYVGARVPDGSAQGETYYGVLSTDAYGELYTWAKAGDIAPILHRFCPSHPTTAYIAALPAEAFVILDWH